ncbi:hypothetical protein BKE38_08760 [Pseudoroseomonas deserti]|uniref:Phage tail protein n=1 Tax=Teichococcus deserti TaxID=1817963 RepID=A0A1V2H652_9PROT|nr:hypothetical protein [Pseudoroseomonas deserti]ONG55748.1 hypothetical protein BKE38_08760 [Pseudoroseomonas deserti]
MTLSVEDFRARLRSHLPVGWFPDNAPVLDAVLGSIATHKSFSMEQLDYVGDQARISTLRDVFLNMFADEFFGKGMLPRRVGEADGNYRARIKRELFRDRGTRPAMVGVIEDLTGTEPVIFEPMNARDTGAYNINMAYNSAGRYGSNLMPYQVIIDVTRGATVGGVPGAQGYGNKPRAAYPKAIGGYGRGAMMYATPSDIKADVTDETIINAINATRPVGTTVWVKIT